MDLSGLNGVALAGCGISLLCVFVIGFVLLWILRLGTGMLGKMGGGGIIGVIMSLLGGLGGLGGGSDDSYDSERNKSKRIPARENSFRSQTAPQPVVSFEEALARQQQAKQAPTGGFAAQSSPMNNQGFAQPQYPQPAPTPFNSPRPSLSKGVPYQPPTPGFPQQPQYPQQGGFPPQQPQQPSGFQPQQPQYPQQGGFPPQQPQYLQQGGFAPPPPNFPQVPRSIPRAGALNNPTTPFDEQVRSLQARQQGRQRADDREEFYIDDSDFDPFN